MPEDRRVELLGRELPVSPAARHPHQRLSFRLAADRAITPLLHAAAGIEHHLRIEAGAHGPLPIAHTLLGGRYVEGDRPHPEGRLRLVEPFPVDVDLPALVARPRGPG